METLGIYTGNLPEPIPLIGTLWMQKSNIPLCLLSHHTTPHLFLPFPHPFLFVGGGHLTWMHFPELSILKLSIHPPQVFRSGDVFVCKNTPI